MGRRPLATDRPHAPAQETPGAADIAEAPSRKVLSPPGGRRVVSLTYRAVPSMAVTTESILRQRMRAVKGSPSAVSAPASNDARGAEPLPIRAGGRAMIIERSRRSRLVIREALSAFEPEEILSYDDPEDAIEELRRQPVSLLVVGSVDAEGRNSALVLERVRHERLLPPHAVVVAISSERSTRRIASLIEHAPDACVLKPLSVEVLRNRLRDVLEVKHRLQPVLAALADGRPDAARLLCRGISAERSPQRFAAWRATIDWLIDNDRFAEVPQAVDEAMRLGTQSWMLLALARAHLKQSRLDEAEQFLDLLLEIWPETLAAYDLRAQVAMRRGAHQEALTWLEQANARTEFNLGRARQTGQEATRAGQLGRAESAYAEIVTRVGGTDMLQPADAMRLVSVLGSRGRLTQAAVIAAQERRVIGEGPDAKVMRALLAQRRASREAGPLTAERALASLLHELEEAGEGATPERILEVIEACLAHGWRADALRIARRLLESERAESAELERLRQLLKR